MPKSSQLRSPRVRPAHEGLGAAIGVLAAALIGISGVWWTTTACLHREVRQSLVRVAKAAAAAVDGDLHRTITSPEQIDAPEYNRCIAPLRAIYAQLAGIKYLYTVTLDGDRVRFVLDTAKAGDNDGDGVEDRSGVWEVYDDVDPVMVAVLRGGPAAATEEPYADRWGTFFTACAPLVDRAGRQVGAVGVDMTADAFLAHIANVRRSALLGLVPAILLSLAAGFATYRLRRRTLHESDERRRQESALFESEERLRTIISAAHDAIVMIDAQGEINLWSPGAEAMFGWTSAEAIGKRAIELLVPARHREAYGAALRAFQENGSGPYADRAVEQIGLHRDGHELSVELSLSALELNGSWGAVGILRGINERKRIEDERRKRMAEIERFNRMALRRESRIVELKRKINELSQLLNMPQPFGSTGVNYDEAAGEETEAAIVQTQNDPEPPAIPKQEHEYELAELLDLEQMQRLLDSFCSAVGVAAALIDLRGKVLVGSRWQRICTHFHRINDETLKKCIESDTRLANRLTAGELFTVYRCCNGLTDAASPVTINGRHMANTFIGQFLLEPPDESFFRRQAAQYGFDETAYLQALQEVPVVPREKLPSILEFLVSFAELAATVGLERLQERQAEARLASHAAELDVRNRELARQREAALNLAEDADAARVAAERSKAELRQSEERFRTMVAAARDAIVVMGPRGEITLWSPGAEAMFGWTAEEALGRQVHKLLAPSRYHEAYKKGFAVFQDTGHGAAVGKTLELTAVHKNGHEFGVDLSLSALDVDGAWGAVGILRDITERKQAEAALRRERDRAQQYLDIVGVLIVALNDKGEITLLNREGYEILGYPDGTLLGQNWFDRCLPERVRRDTQAVFQRMMAGDVMTTEHAENPVLTRAGTERIILWHNTPLTDESGRIIGVLSSGEDITDRKLAESELRTAARTDKLTGLPNRALFLDRLQQAVLRAKRLDDYRFAVLFLDFDRFKIINDSLGHKIGDLLLQEAAARLKAAVRAGDSLSRQANGHTTARLGGDEFVVLLDGIRESADARMVADRLLDSLSQPYHLGEHEVYCTASVGILTSDISADSAEDVLRDADTAMYEAKLAGKGRHAVFDVSMRQRVRNRLDLENDLRKAIDAGQLFLVYQPIVSLESGEVVALEALVRWEHPERGLIPPADFVPIAEDSGLIVPLGEWVIKEACRQSADWRRTHGDAAPQSISVNLSRNQLPLLTLPAVVQRLLAESGLPPSSLHLEITENAVMRDVELAMRVLHALKEVGVMLDMDDFGTGYSSLACLHQFPFDVLKIDRSFIANVDRGRELAALVQAVISLARNLDIRVVAEGIETVDQLLTLQSLGCQYGQGYFFGKPMLAEEAIKFRVRAVSLPGAETSACQRASAGGENLASVSF